jgi:predicted permease
MTWTSWIPVLATQIFLDIVVIAIIYFLLQLNVDKLSNSSRTFFGFFGATVTLGFGFAMAAIERWLEAMGVSHDTAVNYVYINGIIGLVIPSIILFRVLLRESQPSDRKRDANESASFSKPETKAKGDKEKN